MPPAHLRVQSQSAIVVHPGFTDPSPGPSGSNGSGSGAGPSNLHQMALSPVRAPPIRYASDGDGSFDPSPKKKRWYQGLRSKGYSDGSAPVDEELAPPPSGDGGTTSGRSFVVVRKNQGQGQSHRKRPSTAGSSGGDAGQPKGSFVVLRGRGAHSDNGHGGPS